ncbi:MAG: hypothetical protein Q7R68_11215, partial [Nitrospirales bacterium]|nr:hypothetical protein [Nitrospirales bacterium]
MSVWHDQNFLATCGIPPSDPGPMMTCLDPGLRTVGLHEARHVPDTRSDESEAAEALDRRLEA